MSVFGTFNKEYSTALGNYAIRLQSILFGHERNNIHSKGHAIFAELITSNPFFKAETATDISDILHECIDYQTAPVLLRLCQIYECTNIYSVTEEIIDLAEN